MTAATPGTVLLEVTEEGARVIKKSAVEGARLTARLEGSATVMVKENTKPFADVPERHWGASAVAFATAHELFTGTAADTFGPEGEASRAMLFTVLARLEGQNTSGATWYDVSLRWAMENGLTDGSSPESAITREQLATLLYRYAGTPGSRSVAAAQEFPDGAQVSSWAEEAVSWAVGEGLLTGKEHGALDPAGTASRVEVAALFQRLMPILLQS